MKIRNTVFIFASIFAILSSGCDYSNKSVKKEIKFFDFKFVYYKDDSGSLYSGLSEQPIYKTSNCSFKEKGLEKIKKGDLFIDVIKNIGFPRFLSDYESAELDFGKPNDDIYRIAFKEDFSIQYDSVYAYLPYWAASAWCADRTYDLPSSLDIEKLKIGMTLDEVVDVIGKPQKTETTWPAVYYFDLYGGSRLVTTWNTKNNSYDEKPYYLASMEITEKS